MRMSLPTLFWLVCLGVLPCAVACQTPGDAAASANAPDVEADDDVQLVEDVDAASVLLCVPCVDRSTCGTGWCVQFASDSYCAADCTSSGCATGLSCELLTTESGESVHACVPPVDTCSSTGDPDIVSGPDVSTTDICAPGSTTGDCVDAGASQDVNATPDTTDPSANDLTAEGGKLDELVFAVVGDTRPATIDATSSYPSAIAAKIWQRVQAHNVPFAVTTGDYLFATAWGSQGAPQLDKYLTAASAYTGLRLPALGNHECTGATTSNCGPAAKDGMPKNYTAYLDKMLAPLGLTLPYYAFHVTHTGDNWSAKFIFVAANAWDPQQAAWLETEMAKPTTYTFVIRHEPVAADTAPGVKPSEAIINKYPLTIRIVGHTHTYVHKEATREVVIGNGGAPLSNTVPYGYAIVTRRPDDAIEIKGYDYSTGKVFSTFAVNADGTPAP